MSKSDHTNRCFPTGIAGSVSDFGHSSVSPKFATVDGAHQENGLGGTVAAVGPPTATAFRFGRKHHSKSRRRNESDHHSNGFTRPGEVNAVQSALKSLQRYERYTRVTTDTSERRDDEKRRAGREAEETEAAGSAAVSPNNIDWTMKIF